MGRRGVGRTDEALVLRRFPYGESSLVVHVLTRRHGRLAVLAKGAYRPSSGYCGVLDLFDTLSVTWRPASGLALLTAASLSTRRRALTRDLERYRAGLHVLELAGLASRDDDADPALFGLVSEGLDAAARAGLDPELVRIAFDLHFLGCVGLEPALEACASCGQRADGNARSVPVSISSGGRLCDRCARATAAAGRRVEGIPPGTLRIANGLLRAPLTTLERIHVPSPSLGGVDAFVGRFLQYHLESRPRVRTVRSPARRGPARAARAR